jgi:DNA anti-recombination protein RmuC
MAAKTNERPTLEKLQAEVRAVSDRLDAVHDRAQAMEKAARMLADVVRVLTNMPIVELNVGEVTLKRCRLALDVAARAGVA